jgi:uncharacterized protein (DUF2141 family)
MVYKNRRKKLKKIIMVLFLCIMGIWYVTAETLTIRIENADVGKGRLKVGVFNDKETFPDTYFKGEIITATESTMTVTFTDLPKGQYVVSVYQDSNDNGKLDKFIFGIPTEKYGFSNDKRLPVWRNCLFDFNEDTSITIRIR